MTTTTNADDFSSRRFDFIVVGGGTAGLTVAARLAENQSLSIGVLEAGAAAVGEDDINIPGRYGRTLGGHYDWQFETVAQQGLGGRVLPWPRGKVLGGTSALNFMTWNRASRDDYDAWEQLGNAGWGWDSLLPFFKKSETFQPPPKELCDQHRLLYEPSVFGDSGPIRVTYTREFSASHGLWHQTLNSLGVETNEAHLAGSNVGVWTNVCNVDTRATTRSYSTSYYSADSPPSNLHILTEASAQEVVLSQDAGGWTATGVRFTHQGREFTVSASREVVLSAGTIQSPQLLELSGIGKPDVLAAAGIPVKVNSPMVGENLQDHLMLATIFEVDPSLANPDDLKFDDRAADAARKQYLQDGSGPLSILPCSMCYLPVSHFVSADTVAMMASKAGSLKCGPPEHNPILQSRFTKKLGQVEYIFDLGNWSPYFQPDASNGKKYGTMLQILQYPFSRGSIHIRPSSAEPSKAPSSPNALDKPLIDPGYYAGPHGELDLEIMTHGARFVNSICGASPLSSIIRGRVFPPASDDDASLRDWAAHNTMTDWHPVGTCAMGGSGDIKTGVVDERLNVYGVKGLRVVDASIMPLQISAHLQATVYAIAEKGADMILEDVKNEARG